MAGKQATDIKEHTDIKMFAVLSHSDMNCPTDHVSKALLHKPVDGDSKVLSGRWDNAPTNLQTLLMLLLHDRVSVNKRDLL